jgi:hypothetical protein
LTLLLLAKSPSNFQTYRNFIRNVFWRPRR